ncbi:MAG: SAM-dependent methyltransferase, partial [Alloprevotella sp.]
MNDCFDFKPFRIYHDRCAMRVGTDGVLLGAWFEVPAGSRVLDVGAGS